jgi:glycosyltransferase involved in cell wall biosynthesis
LLENGFPIRDLEILVVDGGSQDKTLDLVQTLQRNHNCIRIIHNSHKKTPFALNLGVLHAQYPYLLIAGAHAVYPKNYISALAALMQEMNLDIVGGAIDTQIKNSNPKSEAIRFVLSHRLGVGNSMFRLGADHLMEVDTVPFGLYRKAVFEKAGLYNEKLIRNHDIELSKRIKAAGFRIWLEPQLKVVYFARENFKALAQNNYGNGFWNIRTLFITHKFRSLSLRHFIPLLFVLSLLLPVFGALVIDYRIGFLGIVSLLIYCALMAWVVLRNCNKINAWFAFQTFWVLHLSYGWGSLMGFFPFLTGKK